MELYDWQEEALTELKKHDYNGVIKVASGKGKTILGIAVIEKVFEEYPDGKALVVVPTINLMYQWKKEVAKFFPEMDVSFWFGGEKDEDGKIVVSVINSASKLEFEKEYAVKILDEVHHYGSELYTSIFSLKTPHTIGLSATPEREDEGDLAIRYGAGRIVYSLNNLEELKRMFKMITIRVPLNTGEYHAYMELQDEYYKLLHMAAIDPKNVQRLAVRGNKYALRILKIWSQQAYIRHMAESKKATIKTIMHAEKDEKTIIFSESIEFSELLGELLENSIVVHSKFSKKEVISRLEDFRAKESAVLIAPRLIDEGYDVPDANVAIVASFTRSSRQMIQRDGRVLRRKDYARRYTLVIGGVEEEKYFSILRKTNTASLAKDGLWLKYEDGLVDDSACSKELEEYLKHDDDYEEWIVRKLNMCEMAQQLDAGFYEMHRATIDRLRVENPGRWKILCAPEKKKKLLVKTKYSAEEQRALKEQLRRMNSNVFMPTTLFSAVMRCIEGEEFEMDDEAEEYLEKLVEKDRTDYWPKELFGCMKKMKRKIS